jgi:hypothetical protein
MINGEKEKIWKEALLASLKVLSYSLTGEIEEGYKFPQSEWMVIAQKFELCTSQILF